MTEIEELKAQIKVLQSKLSFLEELEKTKSPVEEAFKDWMGVYPPTNPSVDNIFDIRWRAFQMGYNAAYEEKVSEWEPTPQTPEQVADGLKEAFREAVKQGVVSSTNPDEIVLQDIQMFHLESMNERTLWIGVYTEDDKIYHLNISADGDKLKYWWSDETV